MQKQRKDLSVADRGMIWNTDLMETLELDNLVGQANDELAAESDDTLRHERGRFLGRLLMPRDLREQLAGSGPIVMILDASTARIHWELVTRAGLRQVARYADGCPHCGGVPCACAP